MPCFKGLAVSIHTPDGPLPEYSIQKQSRVSRISAYIPVPPPKIRKDPKSDGTQSEQSTFAISITLLTPGLSVPYSSPKPTPENPYPHPVKVGSLPSGTGERGVYARTIAPYLPLTSSPSETIAAYIYFDGRPKEEVATLLRKGEETWVNSRWVSVPESEGGGLAEREFLFREVGLERWLNGLDLDGKDAAATIEKRRVKLEKKRRRRKIKTEDSDDEEGTSTLLGGKEREGKGVLKYGNDAQSPLEDVSDSDEMLFSDSDDSDDDPVPESQGQIKVALYRVLASGDIRRGEYSPQFDSHEGDEEDKMDREGNDEREEIDHTTGFAKPKTLDPKSISTQTVTGIDPQERPFAVFTFWYRGEKQLQRMKILPTAQKAVPKTPVANGKRRSIQEEFGKFKPLNSDSLKSFSTLRDPGMANGNKSSKTSKQKRRSSSDDSDDEIEPDDILVANAENANAKDEDAMLSPEDSKRQGELAAGVQKIRLKRQHSAEDLGASPAPAVRQTPPTSSRASPSKSFPATTSAPFSDPSVQSGSQPDPNGPLLPSVAFNSGTPAPSTTTASDSVGSPLKKARSSLSGIGEFGLFSTPGKPTDGAAGERRGLGLSTDVLGNIEHDRFHAPSLDRRDNDEGSDGPAGVRSLGGLLGGMLPKTEEKTASPAPPADGAGQGTVKGSTNLGLQDGSTPGSAPGPAAAQTGTEVKMEEEEEL